MKPAREAFEEWVIAQFGEHMRKHLEPFHDEDGYANLDVNFMWLGFNAGVLLADSISE